MGMSKVMKSDMEQASFNTTAKYRKIAVRSIVNGMNIYGAKLPSYYLLAFTCHRYTPCSLKKSVIAFTFSGFSSISGTSGFKM